MVQLRARSNDVAKDRQQEPTICDVLYRVFARSRRVWYHLAQIFALGVTVTPPTIPKAVVSLVLLLAQEMGLGKTVEVIGCILTNKWSPVSVLETGYISGNGLMEHSEGTREHTLVPAPLLTEQSGENGVRGRNHRKGEVWC